MAKKDDNKNYKVIAENRRARYDYAIEDDIECGMMLEGSEVKSLRTGKAQITECYAVTLVPLVLYFNHVGRAKMKIGIAKGKKNHDKRETSAKRDWGRQKARLLKEH